MRLFLLSLLMATLASCAPRPVSAPLPPAETALEQLEQRLLNARVLRLRYHFRAEGAVGAALEGELVLNAASEAELTAAGTFADKPVELRLTAADGQMQGIAPQHTFDEPTPEHLRTALLLGLTRMGILHNLARLAGGRPPDHAGGGVEEWVQPVDIAWMEPSATGGNGLRFGTEVAERRAAEVDLWLDGEGLPLRRLQVVTFPGGTMTVVEEYEVMALE